MAGRDARQLYVEIIGDDRRLSRAFKDATAESQKFGRNMETSFRGVVAGSGAFRSLGRQIAFASGAFLGGAGLASVMRTSVEAASNLAEQTNKVGRVFGESGRGIVQWSKTTAGALGIASDEALEAAGTFGNLFRTVGVVGDQSAEMSRDLVKLAADMASFNNADPSEVLLAIRSGLIGEAEPLRRFGVLLSEARVAQEAMRETGKKNAQDLTAQEKLLARYNLILRDTRVQQDDFAKTSGGLANQQRKLAANVRELQITLGRELIPDVRRIVIATNEWLSSSENQKRVAQDVREVLSTVRDIVGALSSAFEGLNEITGSTRRTLKLLFGALVAFKTLELAGRLTGIATAIGLIGTNATAASVALERLAGLWAMRAWLIPAVAATAAAGAGLASKPRGPMNVSGGVGNITTYQDPATGQYHMVQKRPGESDQQAAMRDMKRRHPQYVAPTAAGVSTADRQPGLSPQGPGAASMAARGAVRDLATARRRGISFQGQMNLLELRLSQALTTVSKTDDRAILSLQRHLLGRWIAHTKDWRKRRELYQDLARVQDQIAAIDKERADREESARQKQRDAERKRLEAHRQAIRDQRERWQQRLSEIRDAAAQIRSEFGELFKGPLLAPSQDERKRTLGVPATTARALVADFKAQTQAFVNFNNDLARLVKRGAPKGLVDMLRGLGLGGADYVHALATASGPLLRDLFKSFAQREKVVQQIAHADVNARYVTINVAGNRVGTTSTTTRRGRTAGRPDPGPVLP